MQFQSHWIKTQDGQKLYAKTWGDENKPALVLVHGYPDNQEVWEPIIEQLISDYYIVTYDVRGAGQSSIPKRIKDFSLQKLSQDLASVTQALLADRAYHLAAHDWGSIQSWESVTDPQFSRKILSFSTISGPCLDHAAFWMRKQFSSDKGKFFKQLAKSWYILAFHLPVVAPTVWHFFSPERWSKMLEQLEHQKNLPKNENISADGQYGIGLYRANFIPRLTRPRERYAICPVQAIVLQRDNFVSPELINEMPNWVKDFSKVEIDANHWAVVSKPKQIAEQIKQFIISKS
ncbi:alpha/beta fold hydrolase [Acinetobacter gerneri]|uniref:AB hydrolase-1 domain-containing protein n=1 Tax=Acinetobacter gerneri DSM 14967 = CIP 107464 = MTCC 9824 TaxID=1120926 RepID=N8ZLD8_9GAMM|nr:alpha/beta fold hydrolase [Acinetobacter gerneri]ENV32350.1 hypothetical protein F960_03744 [Acinetobacter gerneri DSM 14967 = CIP 107464 = MTCC 9824]EPR85146.1 putative oxidoreductase [Acinetobacter gerneri DSM 14967 = CIP 107464 = MTCC 9824]